VLAAGNVKATHTDSGNTVTLSTGANPLLPGDYTLSCDALVWRAPKSITVAAGARQTLKPDVDFLTDLLYPKIPDVEGRASGYKGSLTLGDASGSSPDDSWPFQVQLATLQSQDVDGKPYRWLKITLRDLKNRYTETAYLLINARDWKGGANSLQIDHGWVTGHAESIAKELVDPPGAPLAGSLTAIFSPEDDTLAETARVQGVTLTMPRLKVHDVLVLLFGADCPAANEPMRLVRAKLPAPSERRYSRADKVLPGGPRPCWIVQAPAPAPKPLPQPPALNPWLPPAPKVEPEPVSTLYLVHSDAADFSFADVQVELPSFFKATLTLDSLGNLGDRTAGEMLAEPQFAEAVRRLNESSASSPFDRATLPADGSGASYGGKLTFRFMGENIDLPFTVRVQLVGSEMRASVPHRWLEIESRSHLMLSPEHTERARLLINQSRYEQGEFVVAEGWWSYKDHVFPYEPQGDMTVIEEDLHFLNDPLPPRFSVHDVLALLFDARPRAAPAMSQMRTGFMALVGGPSPARTRTWGQHWLRRDQQVRTVIWTWTDGDQTSSHKAGYMIKRSPRIPFDFAEVKVQAPSGVAIAASLYDPLQDADSLLGEPSALVARAETTRSRVATAREAKPNWKLWTLHSGPRLDVLGARPLLWAEYGGTLGDAIQLREPSGKITPLPRDSLRDAAQIDLVEGGRTWFSQRGEPPLRGHVESVKGIQVRFKDNLRTYRTTDFAPIDQTLLKLHEPPPPEPKNQPRKSAR
jgi:hypothetical protein